MPLVTSARERRLWLATGAVLIAIWSTLGPAMALVATLRTHGLLRATLTLALLAIVAAILWQWRARPPGRREIGVTLAIAAAYLIAFARVPVPEERTHLVEYGIVAALIHLALIERRRHDPRVRAPAALALGFAALLGLLDEAVQAVLPHRVYDLRDVGFNLLAVVMVIGARLSLAWARGRRSHPPVLPLAGAALLAVGAPEVHAAQGGQVSFERHDLITGLAAHQTVLPGRLLDDEHPQIAVVSLDADGARQLHVYALGTGERSAALHATLGADVSFVDVARIAGRDRLLTYAGGRVRWFDPASRTERELVARVSEYHAPPREDVPHVDITHDLNADGRDDLVVPDGVGFSVFVQRRDGSFADPVRVGRTARMVSLAGAEGYRYDPWDGGRVHQMDWDGDGRRDLVFWNGDHFTLHRQGEDGLFAAEPDTVTTGVRFVSDDLAWLLAPVGIRRRRTDGQPEGEPVGRVLHSLVDRTGDGVPDLGLWALDASSLWGMRYGYEVHVGARSADGGLTFAPEPATTIVARGIPSLVEQHDFDGDGAPDMMFARMQPGVFMIVDFLFTRSVKMSLDFYRMAAGGYPDEPTVSHRIRTTSFGASGEKASRYPTVLVGDVDGDGHPDVLIQKSPRDIRIHFGGGGRRLLSRGTLQLGIEIPEPEEHMWLADVDGDGREDVVIHHPSADQAHRVTVLLSR